jgi:site-specific DNA recombinase
MIVALYARVSTTKQAEKDLSIPDQIRQIKEWCKREGHSIAAEYVEEGASATDDRRPVFQRMISEACSGSHRFDCIVVHSLSRFFRELFEFIFYERKLDNAGVKIISITQQTGDDPAGEMARKIFSLFDEYQSKENAKHTLRAMMENARRGFFNGSIPPFGFKTEEVPVGGNRGMKKRLVVDPGEAEVVRKIFDLYLNGNKGQALGMYGVARYLNEKGIAYRGNAWTSGRVNDLLQNPAYIGEHYFNKKGHKTGERKPKEEWILIKVDPIVEENVFKRVEERRKARNPVNVPPRVVNSPTLLTGLLKCGFCGAGMTLATGKGGRYRYYKCTTRIKKGVGCDSRNVPVEKLDDLVLRSLADKVFTPKRVGGMLKGLMERMKRSRGGQTERLKKLNKELDEVQKGLDRLYEAVEKGLLSLDSTLTERAHKLKSRREGILIEIAGIKREQEIPLKVIAERQVDGFCRALRSKLFDRASNFGKEYLRLLIDRIEVQQRQVHIRGSYSALAQALGTKKLGNPEWVPSFGSSWLPE